MGKENPEIGHLCPSCVNAVFWCHREALEKIRNILNTPGEDASVRLEGAGDLAFECLSFFDGYYNACLSHKCGTLKGNEVWVDSHDSSGSRSPDTK